MSEERDIAREAIEGMEEALEHARGEQELETHTVEVEEPDVAAIRERLDMTQRTFADLFGVNLHTLRNWEQGRRRPEGTARVLLQVIDREPEAVLRALHDGRPAAE
jgi:putative transcriptional regulator